MSYGYGQSRIRIFTTISLCNVIYQPFGFSGVIYNQQTSLMCPALFLELYKATAIEMVEISVLSIHDNWNCTLHHCIGHSFHSQKRDTYSGDYIDDDLLGLSNDLWLYRGKASCGRFFR